MITLRLSLALTLLAGTSLFAAEEVTPAASPETAEATAPAAPATESPFKTDREKLSYTIGLEIGKNMQRDKLDVDPATLASGLEDALTGAAPKMSPEEIGNTMMKFQTERREAMAKEQAEQEVKNAAQALTNKAAQTAFLAENGKKEAVKTTASGLQYEVLREGAGESPAATDKVTVHYKGSLLDGTEFDSSYNRGEPMEITLNQLIPGWIEGIQLMKTGAKYRFWIPSDLAYGENGSPGSPIGPNALLVFEIELVKAEGSGVLSKPE